MNEGKVEIEELSFEEAYYQLEQLVEALEQGNLNLDEAINLFERGMRLARWCGSSLDSAELRVRTIHAEEKNASAGTGSIFDAWNEGKD